MNDRFFLYPNEVRKIRGDKGLSHGMIEKHPYGVSKRTMSAIENGQFDSKRGILGNIVSVSTAENLAKVFGVDKELFGYRLADASHTYVPSDASIGDSDKQCWSEGNVDDMDGDHQTAVGRFEELYEKRDHFADDVQAALANAFVQALDHLAQQPDTPHPEEHWNRALDVIGEVEELGLPEGTPSVDWVTHYQAAIIHNQLAASETCDETAKQHKESANELLTDLLHRDHGPLKTSADYQLARIELEEAIAKSNFANLDELEQRFQKCRSSWEQEGAKHRTGYADLSLARVCAFKNDFEDALRYLLSAMREFATFNCHRYVAITQSELNHLLDRVSIRRK